jgi:hypothetical protein
MRCARSCNGLSIGTRREVKTMYRKIILLLFALAIAAAGLAQAPPEATVLSNFEARESHRPAYNPDAPSKFKPTDHVFITSALAVDFTYRKATVTLPLFRGLDPGGNSLYYIFTDASDFGSRMLWVSTTHRSYARAPAVLGQRPRPSKTGWLPSRALALHRASTDPSKGNA